MPTMTVHPLVAAAVLEQDRRRRRRLRHLPHVRPDAWLAAQPHRREPVRFAAALRVVVRCALLARFEMGAGQQAELYALTLHWRAAPDDLRRTLACQLYVSALIAAADTGIVIPLPDVWAVLAGRLHARPQAEWADLLEACEALTYALRYGSPRHAIAAAIQLARCWAVSPPS
ncbi:hypothetical protein [Methylobacterium oxalidis]|uniref:Uncharacterized protein n=1 Tax=Methylobacterium oxalidis TaxID=944322 RepID=A0A512J875_9HYPH|nr:hypothetical protein [Methylobacterium oxalidis]GEP06150.1 hypothetical protein MOX02_41880 [Methylobacterium oxalidis]GJE34586.1 hypothetical protein LDDCCGHA_4798 [Methylobacterium oxalidis]GLS65169.1 hypothetical protein GCM10007888_35510 [Methylobacterium oxalidis]